MTESTAYSSPADRSTSTILRFQVLIDPHSHYDQVRILADGVEVIAPLWGDNLGINPVDFFDQPSLRSGGELIISRCSCGEIGCGSKRVHVRLTEDQVFWTFTGDSEAYYAFSKNAYLAEVERAANDFSWEDATRHIERLIRNIDFSALLKHNLRFEWVNGRSWVDGHWKEDTITLCFGITTGDYKQHMVYLPRLSDNPYEAVESVTYWLKEQEK
jgi:hypothetical protein